MSLAQITLTTNKTISNVGDYVRKIGQEERGQVLPVVVTDAKGSAYDLTSKKIVFSENKDSGKFVVDDGLDSNSGKFELTDPKGGKFNYTLQEQVYPESGTAWFDIVSQDGTVLDTTRTFRFIVIPNATLRVNDDNYSSTLQALEAHYQAVISKTETNTTQLINSLTDKINQAISNGQNDVAAELSDARTKLQQITTDANNLKNSWNTEFGTEKQSFTDLQNQWKAQTAKIQQDADSQIKSINDNAAQQFKNNQLANNAEIAKVEAAKNAAIKEVNDQRDAAINQANTNFQNQINNLQQDYNTWKSEKLADFTKRVQTLTDQLKTDETDLTNFNNQLSDIKTELANMAKQLDSIDFTRFVTGNQFKEAMAAKASGIKIQGLRGDYIMAVDPNSSLIDATGGSNALADTGVIGAALQVVADAILDKNHYTKAEVDALMDSTTKKIQSAIDAKANNSDLTSKADKSQIESLNNQLTEFRQENTQLKTKVDSLTEENTTLKQQVTKLTPVHVSSVDDVARQDAFFVIVDD